MVAGGGGWTEAVKHDPFQPTYFNTNAHFVRSKAKIL